MLWFNFQIYNNICKILKIHVKEFYTEQPIPNMISLHPFKII